MWKETRLVNSRRLSPSTNQLNGNSNGSYNLTAHFAIQIQHKTLNKVRIDDKVILLMVHCVQRHVAVTSGLSVCILAILPKFPAWIPDLNVGSIALSHVEGCFFPCFEYNGLQGSSQRSALMLHMDIEVLPFSHSVLFFVIRCSIFQSLSNPLCNITCGS